MKIGNAAKTDVIVTLTDEQKIALKNIQNWWKENKTPIFVLSGYAGTGKTFLTKFFTNKLNKDISVAISAPTHKAKKVISKMIGKPGVTLHSLLGLRPGVELTEFDPNNMKFTQQKKKAKFGEFSLVIIDEASMINSYLYQLIRETIQDSGTRVLFMGDSAQLPPVNEDLPIVFSELDDIESAKLTHIIRQDGSNPLLEVYTVVRKIITRDLKTRDYKRTTIIDSNNKGIEYITSPKEFKALILDAFNSQRYALNSDYAKVITYTNRKVSAYNKLIRSTIFNNSDKHIEMNEVFMSYGSVFDGNIPLIENATDYIVEKVTDEIENADGNAGHLVTLREVGTETGNRTVFILANDKKVQVKAAGEALILLLQAKESIGYQRYTKWQEFFDYKGRNLTLTDIYQHGRILLTSSFKNGYAITCHKSQGSTYQNVFVDETDIEKNRNIIERWKLKYVGLTRPTDKAIVLVRKQVAQTGDLFA